MWSALEILHFNQKNDPPGSFFLLIMSLSINVSGKNHPIKTVSVVYCGLPRRSNDDIHLVGLLDLKTAHNEVGCVINYFEIFDLNHRRKTTVVLRAINFGVSF